MTRDYAVRTRIGTPDREEVARALHAFLKPFVVKPNGEGGWAVVPQPWDDLSPDEQARLKAAVNDLVTEPRCVFCWECDQHGTACDRVANHVGPHSWADHLGRIGS